MYNSVRQIIVNGLPVEINLSTVRDIDGLSLIATFTSPLTGKSYALIEKLAGGETKGEGGVKIEESLDNICLRACRALFEREEIVTHVLYKDYLLSRSTDEVATSAEMDLEEDDETVETNENDKHLLESAISGFLKYQDKHRRFKEYLKRTGLA